MPTDIKNANIEYDQMQNDFNDQHRKQQIKIYEKVAKQMIENNHMEIGLQTLLNLEYVNQKCYIDELLINCVKFLNQYDKYMDNPYEAVQELLITKFKSNSKSIMENLQTQIELFVNQFKNQFKLKLDQKDPLWNLNLIQDLKAENNLTRIQMFINQQKHYRRDINRIAQMPVDQILDGNVIQTKYCRNKNEYALYYTIGRIKHIQKMALELLNQQYQITLQPEFNDAYQNQEITFTLNISDAITYPIDDKIKSHQSWFQRLIHKRIK